MSAKLIIFCGLFAIALGFTLPEDNLEDFSNNYEFGFDQDLVVALDDGDVLIRNARSPQGRIGGGVEHSGRHGTSAHLNYNHQIGKNFEAYGEAGRNFRRNDNSGMIGLRYRF